MDDARRVRAGEAVGHLDRVVQRLMCRKRIFDRRSSIAWAREEALPEIERLMQTSLADFTEAYAPAEEVERYLPNDSRLLDLMAGSSFHIDIDSEPSSADVFMKEYDEPESEWTHVGVTPIDNRRVPIGIFRWRIEKDGFEAVLAAASTWDVNMVDAVPIPKDLRRVLDEEGSIPEGMVRVAGAETPFGRVEDFFIKRYEVTNAQYKAFVDGGGYRIRDYWQHEVVRDGEFPRWEEATAEFVDQTGRPGPATWQAGDYPEVQSTDVDRRT